MYHTVIKHSGHLRTLEKYRKHSPTARVFSTSFVFSNGPRVLSQYNSRLRLLYLLMNTVYTRITQCSSNEMVSSGAAFFDGEGIGLSHTIFDVGDMPDCSGKISLLKWKFALVFFFGCARH